MFLQMLSMEIGFSKLKSIKAVAWFKILLYIFGKIHCDMGNAFDYLPVI